MKIDNLIGKFLGNYQVENYEGLNPISGDVWWNNALTYVSTDSKLTNAFSNFIINKAKNSEAAEAALNLLEGLLED